MARGVVIGGVVTIGTIGTISVVHMDVLTTRAATAGLDTKTKGSGTTRCCCPQGSSSSTISHLIPDLLITASSSCLPLGLPGLIFTFFRARNARTYLGKLCGREIYSNMMQRTTARTSWGARRDHATKEGMVTKQRSFTA